MLKKISILIIVMMFAVNTVHAALKFEPLFKNNLSQLIKPSKKTSASFTIFFPKFKKQVNKTLYLRFKAYIKDSGNSGWNNYLGLMLNGHQIGPEMDNGDLRLLNRGDAMIYMIRNKKQRKQWWEDNAGIPCLCVFFSNGNIEKTINRIVFPKKAKFEYLINISDFADEILSSGAIDKKKLNKLEFISTFSDAINKSCNRKKEGMLISDIEVGFLDSSQLLKYTNKLYRKTPSTYSPYITKKTRKLHANYNKSPFITKNPQGETVITAGPFTVLESKKLHLTYNGQILIEDDLLTPSQSLDNAKTFNISKTKKAITLNVIQDKNAALKFRKEVVVHKDGKIELTIKTDYASYKSNFRREYSFRVPFKTLVGSSFIIREGRYSWNWNKKGKITANMPDGLIVKNWATRFVAFKKGKLKIVFDGNPLGPRVLGDFPTGGEPMACWSVERKGDFIIFRTIKRKGKSAGGVFGAKMLIYEGEYDYEEKHPLEVVSCYNEGRTNRPAAHFAFGTYRITPGLVTKKLGSILATPVTPTTTRRYTTRRGYGWRKTNNIQLFETHPTNIFRNGVVAPKGGKNTFCFDIRPAYYITTIHAGHPTKNIGPFNISFNGKIIARNVKVKAGETKAIFGSYYLRKPTKQLHLTFSGKNIWAVNKIAVQAIIYPNEDYVFKRKFWMKKGLYEPDVNIDLEYMKLSKKWIPKKKDKSELEWLLNMKMISWSQDNSSTFEFNTPELCIRRAKELKDKGYNTIEYVAFFWQLAYTHQWDKIIAQTKMVVDACHKLGMKVIYHSDVPIVIYGGTGLQYMIKNAKWGMRDIKYDISTLGKMCWNNPEFQHEFLGRLAKLVSKTGLDGCMLDEVYYDSNEHCGCKYCRADFTRDTGLRLPKDPASKVFLNLKDSTWMQWLTWRNRSYGEWLIEVRKYTQKANPNFSIMLYCNDRDLILGNRAEYKAISALDAVKYANSYGTEIAFEDVLDNYKIVSSTRKVMSALGVKYDLPIWGLITNGSDKNMIYFGWALVRMHNQIAWTMACKGANQQRYIKWSEQMNSRYVYHSIADAAILWSISHKDKNSNDPIGGDMHGYSQYLDSKHILHDFILKDDLNLKKISQYKLLIIASIEMLSNKQLEVIRQYVANGGTLLVSGYAGLVDGKCKKRADFPLADLMGVDNSPSSSLVQGPVSIKFGSDAPIVFKRDTRRVSIRKDEKPNILATITQNGKDTHSPAVVVNRYNKGKGIYISPQLGRAVFNKGYHCGCKWAYERNLPVENLLSKIIEAVDIDKFVFRAIKIPRKVIVSAYRYNNAQNNQILVHLLNATGAGKLKKGAIVKYTKKGVVFPSISEDIVFDIKEPIQSGYVVSPDYKGKHPVKIKKRDNGYFRVTLNKNDLQTYSIIYLSSDKK